MTPYSQNANDLLHQLSTYKQNGLDSKEVTARKEKYGENKLREKKKNKREIWLRVFIEDECQVGVFLPDFVCKKAEKDFVKSLLIFFSRDFTARFSASGYERWLSRPLAVNGANW